MKDKWVKNYCPFSRDQGFQSVIGNVQPGETVFGFQHTQVGGSHDVNFATATLQSNPNKLKVTQMADTDFRVFPTKVSEGAVVTVPYISAKTLIGFTIVAENGEVYDIIVIGRISY